MTATPPRGRSRSSSRYRRSSSVLVVAGLWTWLVWPQFLRNIWADERSWDSGATRFFLVHLVLTVVSLVLGTAVGAIGVKGLRGARRAPS